MGVSTRQALQGNRGQWLLRELRRGKDGDGQLTRKEKYDFEGWVLVQDSLYSEQFKAIT